MTESLNNVTIYLTDERLVRADAIVRELSQRAGVKISRSAAIGRAIDDLFLSLRLTTTSEATPDSHTAEDIAA